MKPIIYWVRRDLRLYDNPALHWALGTGRQVVPVYIHHRDENDAWRPGAASCWWLVNSLEVFEQSLKSHGLVLQYALGKPEQVLDRLCRTLGAIDICCNRLYEPQQLGVEAGVKQHLDRMHVPFRVYDSGYWFTPGSVTNQQGKTYRVFTPFWRRIRSDLTKLLDAPPLDLPAYTQDPHSKLEGTCVLSELTLLGPHPWQRKLDRFWRPGETAAQDICNAFIADGLYSYSAERDRPDLNGTSMLSPYLHFGEITPKQVLYSVSHLLDHEDAAIRESVERLLTELGWREFAMHVLWSFPHAINQSMSTRFTPSFWQDNECYLKAWKKGETGYSIIDAGMKQLWSTGWMHNRVRMLVGSFLTKNLGLHWLHGARWFWDTLVDADLANNTMGWQWVAGCGVDAAPYYRIFNPITQAAKYDPHGHYIQHWLGDELRPLPLVDLADSRNDAMTRYRNLIN